MKPLKNQIRLITMMVEFASQKKVNQNKPNLN